MAPLSSQRLVLAFAVLLTSAAAAAACDTAGFKGPGKHADEGPNGLRLGRPVPGVVIAGFGVRRHPLLKVDGFHAGVDLAAAHDDPVGAAAPGRVVLAEVWGEYGNLVKIDHGDGLLTAYAHLSRIDVQAGDCVAPGHVIGFAGATGLAAHPHVHFEVVVDGKHVDPGLLLGGSQAGKG
jgi:murein DD-endopeptidase MepM/ murein hydrolase activator NlpD